MTSHRAFRSPLLTALGTGILLVACSSDDGTGGISSPYRHTGGGSSSTGSGSTSSGSSGSSSSAGATGNSATGGTSSTGSSGSTGTTPPSSSGGTTATSDDAGATAPPAPAVPAFTVAVDNAAPSINLADTTVLTVTITPQSWSGTVTLSAASLPADVTGAFDNATVTLSESTPATAKLTLTSVSSSAPVATPFSIVGTVGETIHNVAATLTVKSYITINLPVNADSMAGGFGTVNITAPDDIANNPVSINFVNLDSTPHEIHAENPKQGLSHGLGTFQQGQADAPLRKVTVAGTYAWHLHDDAPPSGPADSMIVIK
jgi:hypothetical protein